MTNTTNLSRRRLLASSMPALATAAAMAPVAATALCRLPTGAGDDPVFAVIERHRQAIEAYKVTGEISTRLYSEWEEQQDPRGFYLGEYPEIKREVTGEIHALQFREVHTGCMVPRYATCPADIDDSVPAGCADADAWKAQKRREFDEWSGCNEGSPKSVAFDAWNAAHRRFIAATAELNIRPTTLAGVAALLRYIAEFHDDEVWTDVIYEDDDEDCEREPIVDNDGLFREILETLAEVAESIGA
jgi:hypothetical protein